MTLQTPWGTVILTEISSAAPDAEPVWVDISPYVSTDFDTFLGRATELVDGEPGTFSLPLNNHDRRFSPGNPTSPYFPWFKQSRRFRMRELIGYTAFDLCDGFLEIPTVVMDMDVTDGVTDGQAIMMLTVTGIDVLGRLRSAGVLQSVLTQHILANGKNSLLAYYPLTEPAAPFADATGNGYPSVTPTKSLEMGAKDFTSAPGYAPASAQPPNGDDAPLLTVTMQAKSGQDLGDMALLADFDDAGMPINIPAGQVATIVGWFAPDLSQQVTSTTLMLLTWFTAAGFVLGETDVEFDASGATNSGVWTGYGNGTFLLGSTPSQGQWVPVAIRYGWSPNVLEFWHSDRAPQVGVVLGSPTNLSIVQLFIVANAYAGALGHAQVYVGPATDWTHADFVTQYRIGQIGLYGQTTGQRISTILDYAGFPAGRRDIDTGVGIMQNASLAGKDALTAMSEAVDTERGRLYATGGRVVFRDRLSTYDV